MSGRRQPILVPAACLLLLSLACALPAPAVSPPPIGVETQVQATLQALPVASLTPFLQAITDTPPPSATAAPPTETPTETATLTPEVTPTTTASPTLAGGDPRAGLGNPAWEDTFSSGSNWPLGKDSFTNAEVEEGHLLLTGLTTMDGWRLTWPEIEDFYLEAVLGSGDCEGNDHAGLIFRVPDRHAADNGYLFSFTCDGRYWLRRWDGESMTTLVPLTASSAIVAGADKENRIGVWADGEKLALYANSQLLEEVEDDALTEKGGFGVLVGARKSGSLTVEADQIAYWNLP